MRKPSILIAALVLAFVSAASAQPLADRVPANALFYFGWRGVDDPGPGYSDSHWKAILDQSNIPMVFEQTLPQVMRVIGQKDREAAEAFEVLAVLVPPTFHKPTAFFFSGMNLNNPGGPIGKLAAVCQAGADAEAMVGTINQLLAKVPDREVPVRVFQSGDCVVVALGFPDDDPVVVEPGASIKSSREFTNALSQVHPDPFVVAYVDVERTLLEVNKLIDMVPNQQPREMWPKIRDAMGLQGIKRIVSTAGFESRDWVTHSFVEAPEPRAGLMSLADVSPVDDAVLKIVPQDSAMMFAATFDAAKLVETIRTVAGNIDPQALQAVDQGLGAASLFIGKNLQKDVLEPLGEQWVAYASPTVGGAGLGGLIVANRLDDPAKAQQGLTMTSFAVNSALQLAMKDEKDVKLYGRATKVGDQTIYYLGTPIITPSWSVSGNYLYATLYPQNAVAAARRTANPGKSILDNPDYQALRKRLGVEKVTGVKFVDIRQSVGGGYQALLAISRLGLGLSDMIGVRAPELVIPPLDVILPHIAPAGEVTWVDSAGIHAKSVSPFPGAELLGGDISGLFAAAPLFIGIAMPAAVRARESAEMVHSMSQLRQIGVGLMIYAQQHQDQLPDNLGQLLSEGVLPDINLFVLPQRQGTIPQEVLNGPADAKAQWIVDSGDFVYYGGGRKLSDLQNTWTVVVCHEREEVALGDRIAVLFADGHVERLTSEELQERLKK